jgi:hypothetical protein
MSPKPGSRARRARSSGANGRMPTGTRWALAALILIVVVVSSVAGIFWAVLACAGLAWLVVGIVAAFRGSAGRVRSRWAGSLAIFVGLAALVVGGLGQGVVYAMLDTVQTDTASIAAVTDASPLPTATASAKPTPSATPKASATPKPAMSDAPTSAPEPATATGPPVVPKPTATLAPAPVSSQAEVQEASVIPYGAITVDDSNIDVGASAVSVGGGNGEKVVTYLVQYIDGVEVSRSVAREEVTIQPVDEVTSIGTRVPPPVVAEPEPAPENNGCDSNYADACVPIAEDVDCAGGSGNGPAYVEGPVRIVGNDIYDLDNDGDGIACDS